jgi:flagellar motor switch protein FliN
MDAPKGGKAAVAKKPAAKASKAPVSPAPSAPKASGAARNAGLAADVPVQVVAVMGKKTITVRDLVDMKKGQVVELNRFPNEAIDLVANGKLMAKGELVEIDGKLGVRIIKIFE